MPHGEEGEDNQSQIAIDSVGSGITPVSATVEFTDSGGSVTSNTYSSETFSPSSYTYSTMSNQLSASFPSVDISNLDQTDFAFDVSLLSGTGKYMFLISSSGDEISAEFGSTLLTGQSITPPFYVAFGNSSLTQEAAYVRVTSLCVAPHTKIPKVVEIQDVKVGDTIRTTSGDKQIAHVLKTDTTKGKTYVKFSKNCLGEGIPRDDLYITKPHPLSLGYYKNEELNNGVYNHDEDDIVILQIEAFQFIGKLDGIEEVEKDFPSYYNLIFDDHTSIDMEGIDVCSHHPRTGPFYLPEKDYINKEKLDKEKLERKITNPKFMNYDELLSYKPENMKEKDFIRKCLTSVKNDKFRINIRS